MRSIRFVFNVVEHVLIRASFVPLIALGGVFQK